MLINSAFDECSLVLFAKLPVFECDAQANGKSSVASVAPPKFGQYTQNRQPLNRPE